MTEWGLALHSDPRRIGSAVGVGTMVPLQGLMD